jgi:hypothetical protein
MKRALKGLRDLFTCCKGQGRNTSDVLVRRDPTTEIRLSCQYQVRRDPATEVRLSCQYLLGLNDNQSTYKINIRMLHLLMLVSRDTKSK